MHPFRIARRAGLVLLAIAACSALPGTVLAGAPPVAGSPRVAPLNPDFAPGLPALPPGASVPDAGPPDARPVPGSTPCGASPSAPPPPGSGPAAAQPDVLPAAQPGAAPDAAPDAAPPPGYRPGPLPKEIHRPAGR